MDKRFVFNEIVDPGDIILSHFSIELKSIFKIFSYKIFTVFNNKKTKKLMALYAKFRCERLVIEFTRLGTKPYFKLYSSVFVNKICALEYVQNDRAKIVHRDIFFNICITVFNKAEKSNSSSTINCRRK